MWLGLSVRWGGGAERERGREGEGEVLAAQRVVAGGGGADAVLLEDEAYGHSWGLGFGVWDLPSRPPPRARAAPCLGFGASGLGSRITRSGFRVRFQGLAFFCFGCRFQGLGFSASGFASMIQV